MPELPDIVTYLAALEKRVVGRTLESAIITSPFLLRTADPPITSIKGKQVVELRRLGKRICFRFENDVWLVLHLMIAGRLHWHEGKRKAGGRDLATFEFDNGTLTLTEAGSRKRASLHLVKGTSGLETLDPGGIEIFEATLAQFTEALLEANHTLKRALTDPRIFSGIGNAYSDEILFAARLSPFTLTRKLTGEQIEHLFNITRATLNEWIERLGVEAAKGFPEKVTAFRPEMSVHGRYKEPCPRCGSKIQRIQYAANETNYCPNCQTGGKLLADRSLSRLLREDWPKTAEELEGLLKTR